MYISDHVDLVQCNKVYVYLIFTNFNFACTTYISDGCYMTIKYAYESPIAIMQNRYKAKVWVIPTDF